MINLEIRGDKAVALKFSAIDQKTQLSIKKAITTLSINLKNYIIKNKLSGQVLNHRTGNLWRSIQYEVKESKNNITGIVFSSGDVKYAAIHEYGGTIKHPGGTAFFIDSKTGLAKFVSNKVASKNALRTKPHSIPMPERSFMRSSLADMRDEIINKLSLAVAKGIE